MRQSTSYWFALAAVDCFAALAMTRQSTKEFVIPTQSLPLRQVRHFCTHLVVKTQQLNTQNFIL